MIGSLLTRVFILIFGYAYPAYECFKSVEMNKPDIQQLRFWCQYWIIVAIMAVSEKIGDAFISWIPMYSEAKLAFYIYLWFPKTKGTTYVYNSFFRPLVLKHEHEIDHNLLELRIKAGDIALMYWQRAASYGQTRVFEILQFIVMQSTSFGSSPSAQPQKQGNTNTSSTQTPIAVPVTTKPENEEISPPLVTSEPSTEHKKDAGEGAPPSEPQPTAPPTPSSDKKATLKELILTEISGKASSSGGGELQLVSTSAKATAVAEALPEKGPRRSRFRKNRTAAQ
ncbi:unnamed protein product [Cuscuta campestris]|uniref:HVA22-like protein n=1 Tax=Cuscuta campestris TaxID=132261 RepID=A0A484LKD8_9ASTE|nr:unnamed protein product [Cuscuta campestris]